ncbi:LOW QUALITY PROTEIN: hypothetical protein RJ641_000775 [Dillenia turbinata]|uniref:Uncharacterized protein n=1 Tax=Dillenia turbinata TaxID=194707 RepID=A0AAN8WFA1_9MAGN
MLKVGGGVLVGSMDRNDNNILTTGGSNGKIINNDLRAGSRLLKPTKDTIKKFVDKNYQFRASMSGGNDELVFLWDRDTASSRKWLTLWTHPSMLKIAELIAHQSRVLYTAQSPNGCMVASAGGDEMLLFGMFPRLLKWLSLKHKLMLSHFLNGVVSVEVHRTVSNPFKLCVCSG